jgi:hypothetical protein
VSKHEEYEELCTLAMIGEVSVTEMRDLRQHLGECTACREQYREFTQFLLPQLSISSDSNSTFETGYSVTDQKRLRQDFLTTAQQKGHVFSQEAIRDAHTPAPPAVTVISDRTPFHFFHFRSALAASVAALLLAGGYGTHLALARWKLASAHSSERASVAPNSIEVSNSDKAFVQLRAKGEADTKDIAALQERLSTTVIALQEAQRSATTYESGQAALQDQLSQKNEQIAALQSQAQSGQQSVAELRAQVTQLQQRITDSQTMVAMNQVRIHDLNDQLTSENKSLDREREMLSVGRDVRDLMGARNLHIIDVHDANGAGKDRPSYGRIFYTEGKSLIFYAFDLDDKRVMNASYSYEAWGERLGQPTSVKSLGVLYVDDKVQRRWSLKVDDPRQLAEINSVFVTLEPHGGDRDRPQGKKILFAFLGGEPNHP